MSEIVPTSVLRTQYPMLFDDDSTEFMQVLQENFGDSGPQTSDLDRIGIPPGGGTSWEVPSLEGSDAQKVLEGIIVAWQSPRVYWAQSIDEREGEAQPPECSSPDGVFGRGMYGPGSEGNPTGRCDSCPMNAWGSAGDGSRGKACQERRSLYMLLPNGILPVLVGLPVTSITPLRKYFLRLASQGIPYYGVTTRLALERVTKGGRTWSVVVPSMGARIPPEEIGAVIAFGETMRKGLETSSGEVLEDTAPE